MYVFVDITDENGTDTYDLTDYFLDDSIPEEYKWWEQYDHALYTPLNV